MTDPMSDERPEALLKSALEKIVYFEARSTQLSNDLEQARAEGERLKAELGGAGQREIELRRVIAELEVRSTRAHADREEHARTAEALRRERAELIGKMLEASRITGAGRDVPLDNFDLASFIAELRSEVLVRREAMAPKAQAPVSAARQPSDVAAGSDDAGPTRQEALTAVAVSLRAQGRLDVNAADVASLGGGAGFPGRSEETLFGFSVRELAAPDPSARARAAERLKALGHPAAAPALAAALHSETEPVALVAALAALASLAKAEAVPVVKPHLTSASPEVRIASLKALLVLDAAQAAPHLAAAMKDPDKAVRRRASLLALGLTGGSALELGEQAIRDEDADVRALAALVLGASGAEAARTLLLEAMRDRDPRVRRTAGQAMSRLLGRDVTAMVELDHAQRRREVRRLAWEPSNPIHGTVASLEKVLHPRAVHPAPVAVPGPVAANEREPARARVPAPVNVPAPAAVRVPVPVPVPVYMPVAGAAHPSRARVAVLEREEEVAPPSSSLCDAIVRELRSAIRGRPLEDLAAGISAPPDATLRACTVLLNQGQVVRRGLKYFVA